MFFHEYKHSFSVVRPTCESWVRDLVATLAAGRKHVDKASCL